MMRVFSTATYTVSQMSRFTPLVKALGNTKTPGEKHVHSEVNKRKALQHKVADHLRLFVHLEAWLKEKKREKSMKKYSEEKKKENEDGKG